VRLLHPEEQVFAAMLDGWRNQQLARNLGFGTIESRERVVRAFAAHAEAFPWRWTAQQVDDWCTDLRAVRGLRRSTLRRYQEALRLFCGYLTDRSTGGLASVRPGSAATRCSHEWNTAVHAQEAEGDPARRAFTLDELQGFFDCADEQVARIRGAGRKGWLPAFRDATLFKVAYACGLDLADFGRNPRAAEFGEYGVCYVRFGKANKGSPPKRRSVLTVWPWLPEILGQWVSEIRPLIAARDNAALWPSERAARVGLHQINTRFTACRDALGLGSGLVFHSLRRSYVTHLIEAGWDALFVQQQAGHAHASTTSLCTCVSSDYRTRTLRQALDQAVTSALNAGSAR
jgi:site-specific recombinase XerD